MRPFGGCLVRHGTFPSHRGEWPGPHPLGPRHRETRGRRGCSLGHVGRFGLSFGGSVTCPIDRYLWTSQGRVLHTDGLILNGGSEGGRYWLSARTLERLLYQTGSNRPDHGPKGAAALRRDRKSTRLN